DRRATRAAPARRRRSSAERGLTSERIVTAGVAIADAEGLGAVSMRRVASEIGVATMSLYRHVEDKDDLVLQMMDAVFSEWQLPADPPAEWRPRLEIVARAGRGGFPPHPGVGSAVLDPRPPAGGRRRLPAGCRCRSSCLPPSMNSALTTRRRSRHTSRWSASCVVPR